MKTETHRDLAGTTCTAVFDDEKLRRFDVVWRWKDGPLLTACLINPAMLEVDQPDHTGAAIVARARKWGFAGARIVNPFTIRTQNPNDIYRHADPVGGAEADGFIVRALKACGSDGAPFIAGWSSYGAHLDRAAQIEKLAKLVGVSVMAFRLNADGTPSHPARLGHDLVPIVYRPA